MSLVQYIEARRERCVKLNGRRGRREDYQENLYYKLNPPEGGILLREDQHYSRVPPTPPPSPPHSVEDTAQTEGRVFPPL